MRVAIPHHPTRRATIVLAALLALGALGWSTSHRPQGGVPRSDSFRGRSLARSWSVLQPDLVRSTVRGGSLSLELTAPALWFNDSTGVLVHKPVTGNFKVTTTVHTRTASSPRPPAPAIRLGGLMARDPAGDTTGVQSYVHIVAGNGPDGVLAVEHKTTQDSTSMYESPEWPSGDAQLRICRIGSRFDLYKRPVGSKGWQLAASYDRPDLPSTLQVGADIYSPNAPPDLRVRWEEIRFERVSNASRCASDR